jgi:hypothetical protein
MIDHVHLNRDVRFPLNDGVPSGPCGGGEQNKAITEQIQRRDNAGIVEP